MRKGTCKHFTGAFHDKTCRAGVVYDEVTPEPERAGRALRLPRHLDLANHQKRIDAMLARHRMVGPLVLKIKKEHAGKGWSGVETCPVCGGKLHLSHAALNGHVWGRCETAGCLAWME